MIELQITFLNLLITLNMQAIHSEDIAVTTSSKVIYFEYFCRTNQESPFIILLLLFLSKHYPASEATKLLVFTEHHSLLLRKLLTHLRLILDCMYS